MASKAITTIKAKKKMLLARAGLQDLTRITQMAFGSGGVDDFGEVLQPDEDQEELVNEICRKDIKKIEVVSDTKISYYCTIGESELTNAELSELALVDEEGDLMAIKNFKAKGKDSDFSMTFKINDTM